MLHSESKTFENDRLLTYLSLPNLNVTYFLYKSEYTTEMNSINHIQIKTYNELINDQIQYKIKRKTQYLSKSYTSLSYNKEYDTTTTTNNNNSSRIQNISHSDCLLLFKSFNNKSECVINLTEQKSQLSFNENELINKNKHINELTAQSDLYLDCNTEIQKQSLYGDNQRNVSDSLFLLNTFEQSTSNPKYYNNRHHSLKIKKTKYSAISRLHSIHFIPHGFYNYFYDQIKKSDHQIKRHKTLIDKLNTTTINNTTNNTTTNNSSSNPSVKKQFLRHFSFIYHDRKLSSSLLSSSSTSSGLSYSNHSHLKIAFENNDHENCYHNRTTPLTTLLDKSPRLERKLSKLAIGVRDKITTLCRSASSALPQSCATDIVISNHRVFLEKLFRSGGPTREDVEDWARSFESVLRDKYGVLVFREFLRTEFSDENIRFWLICEDYRNKSGTKNMQRKAFKIFNEYVAVQAAREVNLDSNTRLQTERELASANKNTFDQCQRRVQSLMEKDSYRRFLRSDLYLTAVELSRIRECNMSNKLGRHSVIDFRGIKSAFTTSKYSSVPPSIASSTITYADSSSSSMTNLNSKIVSTKMNEK
uniref:Putative regulator of G protein signaling n=1 Tax=Schistosoma mansoni TaxID=6183 RepID=A0A3Q0KHC2_SCHMA